MILITGKNQPADMRKNFCLRKLLNTFYYVDGLYWYSATSIKHKLINYFYINCAVVVIFGSVNYISMLYRMCFYLILAR